MQRALKNFIHHLFWSAGYQIQKIPKADALSEDALQKHSQETHMLAGLARAHLQKIPIATVIDVGASDGQWTQLCLKAFPTAHYLLIEALDLHEPKLQELCKESEKIQYVMAAAGPYNGDAHLHFTGDLFGGAVSTAPFRTHDTLVPMMTVDALVEQRNLLPPYLLKLDTHGFELPIFDGAVETLKQTELIVVEAYNFEMNRANRSVRFHELCAYMEEHGFRCSDLVDPAYRPKDYFLWQMDLFFRPASRAEFQYKGYN